MNENLKDLFGQAVADEPAALGDVTDGAIADGTRIRRRRRLVAGPVAAVALVAALGATGAMLPSAVEPPGGPVSVSECGIPDFVLTEKPVLFLSARDDVTAAQRAAIETRLGGDELVRGFTWTDPLTVEQLVDAGMTRNVRVGDGPDLPGRYRVELAEPDRATEFLDDYADVPGVDPHGVQLVCRGGVWP
ncbi:MULTISPECIES: hypothetical protein [Catenuloplanes]|uniref:FtsX extracellular domain-containing protein n=1 Tax=Catenuloplanes niger TaxID=587534 RepID=A0AAE3ZRV9_9ACTN|nr:hypothetical protein [Catenuloplanes niger]MDR7324631.1 hypothetical protein [Catenuloplanes niger]